MKAVLLADTQEATSGPFTTGTRGEGRAATVAQSLTQSVVGSARPRANASPATSPTSPTDKNEGEISTGGATARTPSRAQSFFPMSSPARRPPEAASLEALARKGGSSMHDGGRHTDNALSNDEDRAYHSTNVQGQRPRGSQATVRFTPHTPAGGAAKYLRTPTREGSWGSSAVNDGLLPPRDPRDESRAIEASARPGVELAYYVNKGVRPAVGARRWEVQALQEGMQSRHAEERVLQRGPSAVIRSVPLQVTSHTQPQGPQRSQANAGASEDTDQIPQAESGHAQGASLAPRRQPEVVFFESAPSLGQE